MSYWSDLIKEVIQATLQRSQIPTSHVADPVPTAPAGPMSMISAPAITSSAQMPARAAVPTAPPLALESVQPPLTLSPHLLSIVLRHSFRNVKHNDD